MPKVSIIMPSLNVIGYIRETIESVLAQTLQDIEILCVDAGSTDGTWEALEEYAQADSRIRLIRSDKKSYGYQMNLGIREARGEYIGIVETDDLVRPDMYQALYDAARQHDAWVVKSDFDLFTERSDGTRISLTYALKRDRVPYGVPYSKDAYISGEANVECYIWNAIYKKCFLEQYQIRFNESPGAAFQDFGFKYQVAFQAERIVAVNRSFYQYRRSNSGSSTYNSKTVEFNLAEAKFLLAKLKERGLRDTAVQSAAAREIVQYAIHPYQTVCRWGVPSDGTAQAFEEYQAMFRAFAAEELIQEEQVPQELWLRMHLLMKDVQLYLQYTDVFIGLEMRRVRDYVKALRTHERVFVFGCGVRGNAIYSFLYNSGLGERLLFCDNNEGKWGTMQQGVPVLSPAEAVKNYPNAAFVVSSAKYYAEMLNQLNDMGIARKHIFSYRFLDDPLYCTNCMMKER